MLKLKVPYNIFVVKLPPPLLALPPAEDPEDPDPVEKHPLVFRLLAPPLLLTPISGGVPDEGVPPDVSADPHNVLFRLRNSLVNS